MAAKVFLLLPSFIPLETSVEDFVNDVDFFFRKRNFSQDVEEEVEDEV